MSQYDLEQTQYDMSNLERHSTYDQFMSLRDTLVFSWKKYNGKAWCLLCVWESEETVEILWNNLFRQSFQSMDDWNKQDTIIGPYVEWDYNIASNTPFGPLSCVIQKDWWYRLMYKMEVLPTSTQKKVYTYFDIYRPQHTNPETYNLISGKGTAVFDRQWEFEKTFSGTTSWTDPNWSCSVKVKFVLWEIIQKITAFWYIERDLKKWDIVVMRAKDAERWSQLAPDWNDLTLQADSNYLSVEYLNLPHNNS